MCQTDLDNDENDRSNIISPPSPSPSQSFAEESVGLGVDIGFDTRLYFCVEERASVRGTWRKKQGEGVQSSGNGTLVEAMVSEAMLEGYERVYSSEDMLRVARSTEKNKEEATRTRKRGRGHEETRTGTRTR